ncbi:hypothetical protein FQZ97_1268110 [compost metagenome]
MTRQCFGKITSGKRFIFAFAFRRVDPDNFRTACMFHQRQSIKSCARGLTLAIECDNDTIQRLHCMNRCIGHQQYGAAGVKHQRISSFIIGCRIIRVRLTGNEQFSAKT